MDWILWMVLSTGGFMYPSEMRFADKDSCITYLKQHKKVAKHYGETVVGYCEPNP